VITLEEIPEDKFRFVTEIHHAVTNVIQPKVIKEPVVVEEIEEGVEELEEGAEVKAEGKGEPKSEDRAEGKAEGKGEEPSAKK
jgi:hypothetical protein